MRILAVQDTDWFERGPHQQHHILERLSLRDHEVRVVDYPLLWREGNVRSDPSERQTYRDGSRFVPGSNIDVVRPPIIPFPVLDHISHAITMRREIRRQVEEFAPDLILGHGIISDWAAAQVSSRERIPYIAHVLDALHLLIESPGRKLLRPIAKKIEASNYEDADYIISINKRLKEYIVSMGGSRDSTHVIPAGIDSSQFRPDIEREQMRRELGLGREDVVLFFMGWLYEFSGVLDVAEEVLSRENSDLRLVVVGDGDLYDDLQRLKADSNRGERLVLTGRRPYEEIPNLLTVADICLLPAVPNETMRYIVPIKIYEYLASKKPVIATKTEGIYQEFGEGSGIFYIRNPSEAVDKALEAIRDNSPDEITRLTKKSLAGHTWDNLTTEFEDVLRGAVAGKQPKAPP